MVYVDLDIYLYYTHTHTHTHTHTYFGHHMLPLFQQNGVGIDVMAVWNITHIACRLAESCGIYLENALPKQSSIFTKHILFTHSHKIKRSQPTEFNLTYSQVNMHRIDQQGSKSRAWSVIFQQ